MIERRRYLEQLVSKKDNCMVKAITGIGRSGKSFLPLAVYHQHLNSIGAEGDQIIEPVLDDESAKNGNPLMLGEYIRSLISDTGRHCRFSNKNENPPKPITRGCLNPALTDLQLKEVKNDC